MQKTGWAHAALRGGVVVLGAGLLSATALTSAEAAESSAAPQPAAQGSAAIGSHMDAPAIEGYMDVPAATERHMDAPDTARHMDAHALEGDMEAHAIERHMDAPAMGAEAADSTSMDPEAQDPAETAPQLVPATVIAGTGLWVHSRPDTGTGTRLVALPRGTSIAVQCQKVYGTINWYYIHFGQQPTQGWVDGSPSYVYVPSGSGSIPGCAGLGGEDNEGSEPTSGSGTGISVVGPINGPVVIKSNHFGDPSSD